MLGAGLAGPATAQSIVIGAPTGSAPSAPSPSEDDPIVLGVDADEIVFNHTGVGYVFAPAISGTGNVFHHAGETVLTGDSPMSGLLRVDGGALIVEGAFGDGSTTAARVQGGGDAASLTIRNGGVFRGRLLTAEGVLSEPGRLVVTGTGSRAEAAELYVGSSEAGGLVLADGGAINAGDAWFGYLYGSVSTVRITGAGSLLDVGYARAGMSGTATVTITDGATLRADFLDLTSGWDAESRLTVAGATSVLDVENTLLVAPYGNAVLEVRDGASARADALGVAAGYEQYGIVRVEGEGASFTVDQDVGLGIGESGRASLSVTDGARFGAASFGIGYAWGASGDVLISGAGSRIDVGEAAVGYDGHGRLILANGGTLALTNAANDTLWLGLYSDASGRLVIGSDPLDGGEATGAGYLEAPRVALNNDATVIFNHSSDAYRFDADIRGRGDIEHHAGETLLGGDSEMIGQITVRGGRLIVEGPLRNRNEDMGQAGTVVVGAEAGDVGALTVRNGGLLTSGDLIVGAYPDAHGRLAVEDDAVVDVDFAMLGYDGFADISLIGGASLNANFLVAGASAGSLAAITLSGEHTRLQAGLTMIGSEGQASLQVLDGAVMEADALFLGGSAGGQGAAEVVGQGSRIDLGDIAVGLEGDGLLRLSKGGALSVGYEGAGVLALAAYEGSRGELVFGGLESDGDLSAAGDLQASEIEIGDGEGIVTFRHDGDLALWSPIRGEGLVRAEAGVTRLVAENLDFTGRTMVGGGRWDATLVVDGQLAGNVRVAADGVLTGRGALTGEVVVEAGGRISGVQGQTLTLGTLVLGAGAFTDVVLGAPGDQAVFDIVGDLTLDGILNVDSDGQFEVGIHRLFDYGGALIDHGLEIGETPELIIGVVQTAVAGQVNLVTGRGPMWFWDGGDAALHNDGVVNGGDGLWRVGGTNFTTVDGRLNGDPRPAPAFVVFQGRAGDVVLDASGGAVTAAGLQFAENGYTLQGDALTIGAEGMVVRVGDGTAAGADMTARITAALAGTGNLVKSDAGTLELTGRNTYEGDTILRGGVLAIGGDDALGGPSSGLAAEGGDLRLLDDWTSGRDLTLTSVLGLDTGDFHARLTGGISGAGRLVKGGSGRLTLEADNSGWTGAVEVAEGELDVTGSIGGDVTVRSGAGLFGAGVIGGDTSILSGGSLNGAQGQTLTFGGDLELFSATRINVGLDAPGAEALFEVGGNLTLDGVLNVTSAGEFGAGVYRLFNYGGALTNNGLDIGSVPMGVASSDLAVQTVITGQVNLLNGADATLLFWDGDGAGSANNGRVDGGDGVWSRTSINWTDADGSQNGAINPVPGFTVFMSQGGTVTVDGAAGALSVDGMQFAADGYVVQGDSITLANADTAIRVGDGTAAGGSMTATINSILSGSGRLVKSDLGVLVLTGDNTYAGGTYVQAGTLVGSTGSIRGDIVNDGVVRLIQTQASADLTGATSGSGHYIKAGSGALRLVGASSSDWIVEQGELTVSGAFTGDAALATTSRLTFDQSSGARVWGGVLSGSGAVEIKGADLVRFTGQSRDFTGVTTVNGWLAVDGRLGGSLEVAQGGRLQGSGRVGNLIVAGEINPGNSIGTLQVNGDLTFLPGSVYEVEVDPKGQSDRIAVQGAANLLGGSVLSLGSGGAYVPETAYTILTAAGGVTGQFGSVASDLAFLDAALNYTSTSIVLTLVRNDIDFGAAAWTSNQRATAPAIEALGFGDDVYDAVLTLSVDDARLAFDQLSGDAYGSLTSSQIEDSRIVRAALIGRLNDETGRGAWFRAYGLTARHAADFNAGRFERDLTGMVMGADTTLPNGWRVGVGGGYAVGDYTADTRGMTSDGETWSLGAYTGRSFGSMRLALGGAWSWQSAAAAREVIFPGFAEVNISQVESDLGQAFAEASWALPYRDAVSIEPYVNAAFIHWSQQGFVEAGGASALAADAVDANLGLASLGARASGEAGMNGWTVRLNARAGLRQIFGDRDVNPLMTIGGEALAGVRGLSAPGLAAEMAIGVDIDVRQDIVLNLSADALASGRGSDAGATVNVAWRF